MPHTSSYSPAMRKKMAAMSPSELKRHMAMMGAKEKKAAKKPAKKKTRAKKGGQRNGY